MRHIIAAPSLRLHIVEILANYGFVNVGQLSHLKENPCTYTIWTPSPNGDDYFTLEWSYSINMDIKLACMFDEIDQLSVSMPSLMRVPQRDHSDFGAWFAVLDIGKEPGFLSYNQARENQYNLRQVYEAQGIGGIADNYKFNSARSIYVFGEPNTTRLVYKAIRNEICKRGNYINLSQDSKVMELASHKAIILVQSDTGHYSVMKDNTVTVDYNDVFKAARGVYRNVDYVGLYNHPLFN